MVKSIFPGKEVVKEKESCKLKNPIANHVVNSVDETDEDAGTRRYSAIKKLLLEYIDGDSGLV